jgi:phosphoribosylanthranilate isomerase
LTAENLPDAIAATDAACVDVSSGVEEPRGVKSPDKITRFLAVAKSL